MKIKDKRITIAMATVAATALVLFLIPRDDGSVLSRAKPVCKTDNWAIPQADYGFYENCNMEQRKLNAHYLWLSADEIMTFKRTENRLQTCRIKLRPDTLESAVVSIPNINMTGKLEPISISPDGKSLLWYNYNSNTTITPHIATLDGSQSKKFSSVKWQKYFWSADCKSLVYTTPSPAGFDFNSIEFSNKKTRKLVSLKTSMPKNALSELSLSASGEATFDAYDSKSSSTCFVTSNLQDQTILLRVNQIKLHKNERAVNSLLSPDGNTLLVSTTSANSNFFEKLKSELTNTFNSE